MGFFNEDSFETIGDNSMTMDDMQDQGSQFVSERGTTMDILHDLWVGSGQAMKLIGEGTGIQGLEDAGEYVGTTEFAKPDVSQYYGTQGRIGRVVDMIAQSAPLTLGIGGATALGATAGPLGAAAAFTGAMGAVGKGTFDQSTEELRAANPNATDEEVFNYGLINAVSEVGSEGLGILLPFGLGKMAGKGVSKTVIKNLVETGRVTPAQAISSVVKRAGGKESATALFGGATADGAGEVINELVQSANREGAGLEEQPVDLIDLFLAGSAPGGAITAGTLMADGRAKGKVKAKLEEGLSSPDWGTRAGTTETMGEAMDQIDPGLGDAFRKKMEPLVAEGPVNLDQMVEQETVEQAIIETPEAVLEEAGIPTKKADEDLGEAQAQDMEDIGPEEIYPLQAEDAVLEEEDVTLSPTEAKVLSDQDATRVSSYMAVSSDTDLSFKDYQRAMEDEALKGSILMGMDQVEQDTNELRNPELTLVERRQLKKNIKQTKEMIAEEVQETKPVVAEETTSVQPKQEEVNNETVLEGSKGIPKAEPTNDRAAVQQTKEDTVKKTEKAPTRPLTEQKDKKQADAPVKPKAQEKAKEKAQEDKPLTQEESDRAIKWTDKGVSAEDSMLLAKRGTPITDDTVEVEEYRDEPEEGKKTGEYTGSRFTDGSTIEAGTGSNDKLFRVTKDGIVYRASSRTKATEGIQGTRKLELWEDKDKDTAATKVRAKLTDKQKTEIDTFIKKQGNADGKLNDADAYTASFKRVTNGMKMNDMQGIYALALGDVAGKGGRITPGEVRKRMAQLTKAEENTTEVTRKAKQGLNVASVSAEEMFAKDEAVVANEEAAEMGGLETEDIDGVTQDDKGSNKIVAYTQEGKQKYTLKKTYIEPDGTKAKSKAKATEAAKEVLATSDGRFVVLTNPRKPMEPVSVTLVVDGDVKGTYSNPQEAMEAAKFLDEINMEATWPPTKASVTMVPKSKFANGTKLLENVANQTVDPVSASLAKMLLAKVPKEKLDTVGVKVHTKMNFYHDGTVYLKPEADPKSQLHELVHSITVQEMANDLEATAEVTKMREDYTKALKDSGVITEEIAAWLEGKNTSLEFIGGTKEINWKNMSQYSAAYSTLNNQEFLAMAFGNVHVQTHMKNMKGKKKGIWEKLKGFIGKALGLDPDSYTMLEEVLETGTRIASEDIKDIMDSFVFAEAPALDARKYPVKTDEATRAVLKSEGKGKKTTKKITEQLKNIKNLAEFVARPVSDMIREISPKLHGQLMKFEAKLILKQKQYSDEAKPFMSWYRGLTRSQQVRYDFALMNSQTKENQEIIKEIPKDAYKAMEGVLKDLKSRQDAVGLSGTDKDFYFPRRVKDVVGLTNYLMKDSEYKGEIGKAFQVEAQRLGQTALNEDQKAQVMTDMFQAGHFRQLPRPGASKKRTVPFVSPETYEFYSNSSEALIGHIFEMNEKIGQREFIGGSTRKKDIQGLEKMFRDIEKMPDGAKKNEAMMTYDIAASKLEDIETDLQDRLGATVAEEMKDASMEDQMAVRDLINARLRQKGASGVIDSIRNIGYATTMGNFLSAITQLGDIPILFYNAGFNKESIDAIGTAFKNVAKIAKREMTGEGGPTGALVEEADFTNVLREFTQGDNVTGNVVEKLFKYSGLKFTDLIGKEAYMQAAWSKWKKPKNKEEFYSKYEPFFGADIDSVYAEMQGKEKTRDVMTVLIAELAEFQPVSLSQQSKGYLGAGNFRMAYMLKTFTLRATSAALREGHKEMKKGNYAKGAAKVASIIMLYSMAGAGADELKDLIRGKESSITDNTFDNVLGMFFMSKYGLEKGSKEDGIVKNIMVGLLPPVRYADNLLADLQGLTTEDKEFKAKSLTSVPLIGTIAYSRSSAGQATYSGMERKDLLEEVKKNKEGKRGAYAGGLSRRISEYNKKVTTKEEKISNDSVMRAYRSK